METAQESHNNYETSEKDVYTNKLEDEPRCKKENYVNYVRYPEILTKKFPNQSSDDDHKMTNAVNVEEPMDLTFSQRNVKLEFDNTYNVEEKELSDGQIIDGVQSSTSMAISKLVQADQMPQPNPSKKRGRKKKDMTNLQVEINNELNCIPSYDNTEFMQIDSRQGEVLMAAKSLFSKRTRTLYHWMYPNAPKAQLKSAVSMSWETLGVQEKEFYISQVLGRFGFPQSSLMVNPQLGGLRGVYAQPPLDLSTPAHINLETHTAVSTILNDRDRSNEAGTSWPPFNYANAKKNHKKRGKIGRPPGTKTQKLKENVPKPVSVETIPDDFPDDPELRKEFEQFKWTLHMTEK